jgi:hypothetical protein
MKTPLETLKHHVTGAIERGEAVAVAGIDAPAFKTAFDSYACAGDTITGTLAGYDLTARIEYDNDARIDDDDCHNIDQDVTGCNDKQQENLMAARRAWRNDEWFYCGIVLSVSRNGILIDEHAASLWGVECNYPGSDNAYLLDVANELAGESVEQAEKERARIVAALTDSGERAI